MTTATIRAAIHQRDLNCQRCGKPGGALSVHHRQRRAVGPDRPSNLILLCGSGTTGCHGWAHAHPRDARRAGYIVSVHVPADAIQTRPVWSEPWQRWVLLNDDWTITLAQEGEWPRP